MNKNFRYKHRCVIINDDEKKLPTLGKYLADGTREIEVPDELYHIRDKVLFHKIVLTYGYYEGACLDYWYQTDYQDDQCNLDFIINKWYYFSLGKEGFYRLIDPIVDIFDITESECRAIIDSELSRQATTGINIFRNDELYINEYEQSWSIIIEKITNQICDNEVISCNKILDHIKEKYGYEELFPNSNYSFE